MSEEIEAKRGRNAPGPEEFTHESKAEKAESEPIKNLDNKYQSFEDIKERVKKEDEYQQRASDQEKKWEEKTVLEELGQKASEFGHKATEKVAEVGHKIGEKLESGYEKVKETLTGGKEDKK